LNARKPLLDSAKFLAIFTLLFALSSTLLAPLGFLNELALESTRAFLWAAGVDSEPAGKAEGFPVLRVQGFPHPIQINDLCAAKIELAVLFGIIFATTDRTMRHRAYGFLTGSLLALLFNPVRIGLSILFFNPIIHDILFRTTLVLAIVSYYALWYAWLSAPREGKTKPVPPVSKPLL